MSENNKDLSHFRIRKRGPLRNGEKKKCTGQAEELTLQEKISNVWGEDITENRNPNRKARQQAIRSDHVL